MKLNLWKRHQVGGIGRDITERTCQLPLVASEICSRRLFETSQDGILLLDSKTAEITDASLFLTNLLGDSH